MIPASPRHCGLELGLGASRALVVLALLLLTAHLGLPSGAGLDEAYRLYKKAERKLETGEYTEALALIDRALERHAESGELRMGVQTRHYYPHYLRGLIQLRLGDSAAAREDFQKELEQAKIQDNPGLHGRLIGALQEAEAVDTEAPVLHVDDAELVEFDTGEDAAGETELVSVRLRGFAVDSDSGIRSMTVAGREIALTSTDGAYRFDETVTVDGRTRTVDVVAVDSAGNAGQIEYALDIPPLDLGPVAEGIHAVVVGVNEYDRSYRTETGDCRNEVRASCGRDESFACYSLPDLSYAASDAQSFYDLLRRRGVPQNNVQLLTSRDGNRQATRDEVLTALERLEHARGDKAIFFFSGHGVSSRRQENLMLLSDTKGWECGKPADDEPTAIEQSALGVTEVAQALMRSPIPERYIILDACRSPRLVTKGAADQPSPGFSVSGIKGIGKLAEASPEEVGLEPIVFYSTLEKKVSVEWNRKSSGYFTYFLLQGLRRDLPLDELKRYVQSSVKRQTMQDLCSADKPAPSCPYLQAPYLQLPKALEQNYDLQSRTFILGRSDR